MEIFCDASFDNKRRVAGWGLIIKDGAKEKPRSNWFHVDNINLAEIFAIHTACVLMGGEKGTIYTDSQTALAYINGDVKEKPRTREQYINHQKMKFWAAKIRKFDVKIEKIKAHQKNMQLFSLLNHEADINAKKGLSKYYLTKEKSR